MAGKAGRVMATGRYPVYKMTDRKSGRVWENKGESSMSLSAWPKKREEDETEL